MGKNEFCPCCQLTTAKERAEEVKSHIDSIPKQVDFNTFCHFVHDWVLEDENNDLFFSILSNTNVEANGSKI
ncbi:hypothetical protein ACEQPO_13990 [Bacillus sp. SL00103]